ncbi:hypothetical protein CTAYLR_010170 [Chrysophaeum taylorii]|uniref:Phosphatidylinositol 3-kinase n=1 Tax=Chrysophaeum taylorii TaxID=2483200 RepID=A0AAD7XT14_9STRA|nr:hypothetical protein CTAYLR_010170 [Chrysophaeum taylorii]
MPTVFRSVSRRAMANTTKPLSKTQSMSTVVDDGEAEGRMRTSSLLHRSLSLSSGVQSPQCSAASRKEYSGVLEKQKGTMRTWPKRYCWAKDGKLSWAETRNDAQHGKERGGLLLRDVRSVERKPTDDRPWQFVVKTDERTINLAAETSEELEAWMGVLAPRTLPSTTRESEDAAAAAAAAPAEEDDDSILRRFSARLVRSEEVVVTVRSNLGVEIGKYVGGGFRLRLDELQAPVGTIDVDADQARALGLTEGPVCVVARGNAAWSAADEGTCFLAMADDDARRDWRDCVEAVSRRAADGGLPHSRLAGWKLAPLWWTLFDEEAKAALRELETWIRKDRPGLIVRTSTDARVRFPNRLAPPPSALADRELVASVALPGGAPKVSVRCTGSMRVDDLLEEVAVKLAARASLDETASPALLAALAAPGRCALRVAHARSYLCRRDAPLLASYDFAAAFRSSVKPVPTVGLILETSLTEAEATELGAAHERLAKFGDRLAAKTATTTSHPHFSTNELAAALRARPPNTLKLENLPDAALEPYVPQLVQALKDEAGGAAFLVSSTLARFLLERALLNPTYVGSSLFWSLRSEMSKGGQTALKHGVLLAAYLGAVGTACRSHLEKQVVLDSHLRAMSAAAARLDDRHARTQFARRELRRLARSGELPASMPLPCVPGRLAGALQPDKCRVLSSKAAPVLLVFDDDENPAEDIFVIFKTRDDLRQDAAMLQSMRQMDALWLAAGYECWLRTYSVAATDVDVGWIEVVRGAKETAEIQSLKGGALGALKHDTLKSFLEEHNAGNTSYVAAEDRFVKSCAACCVSTYVLGIADRHNGNIMLSTDGRLFHIDFGHVLGHFKKLKGTNIKREKTKLVLTPEMMYVINGGKGVSMNETFTTFCCSLIGVLRESGNIALLLQLVKELVPAELPEISDDSIKWLPEVLLKPDAELRNELSIALSDWVRRLDNANHNRIHQSGPSQPKRQSSARRVSTVVEAQQEVEELRRLLTAEEAKNADLTRQLELLRGLVDDTHAH